MIVGKKVQFLSIVHRSKSLANPKLNKLKFFHHMVINKVPKKVVTLKFKKNIAG